MLDAAPLWAWLDTRPAEERPYYRPAVVRMSQLFELEPDRRAAYAALVADPIDAEDAWDAMVIRLGVLYYTYRACKLWGSDIVSSARAWGHFPSDGCACSWCVHLFDIERASGGAIFGELRPPVGPPMQRHAMRYGLAWHNRRMRAQ